jgi:hypothetical protein
MLSVSLVFDSLLRFVFSSTEYEITEDIEMAVSPTAVSRTTTVGTITELHYPTIMWFLKCTTRWPYMPSTQIKIDVGNHMKYFI